MIDRDTPATILVTGSAGFIGAYVVRQLVDQTCWTVIGIDSFRHRGDSFRVSELGIDPDRYAIITADLSTPVSRRLKASLGRVDAIVNLASLSNVDESLEDPTRYITNNVAVAANVFAFAREEPHACVIQVSTDEVYGPAPPGAAFTEWSPIVPSNPYSASKACQEAVAIAYWRSYGTPTTIVNLMNVIGERQDVGKFVPLVVRQVLRGEEVQVHASAGRPGSRAYLHASDAADAILFLLSDTSPRTYDGAASAVPDRYNVAGVKEIDNLALTRAIGEILGRHVRYRVVDGATERPGHDMRYALDGAKLQRLGWRPRVDFDEALSATVRWLERHPEWLE